MPQSVEVGNLAVRVLWLEELVRRSSFVSVCDLLDFGQPDRSGFVQVATKHLSRFLGPCAGPQCFDQWLGLGAADVVCNTLGKALYNEGTVVDITKRKKAEARRRKRREERSAVKRLRSPITSVEIALAQTSDTVEVATSN